jgi:hypothetical protein
MNATQTETLSSLKPETDDSLAYARAYALWRIRVERAALARKVQGDGKVRTPENETTRIARR